MLGVAKKEKALKGGKMHAEIPGTQKIQYWVVPMHKETTFLLTMATWCSFAICSYSSPSVLVKGKGLH